MTAAFNTPSTNSRNYTASAPVRARNAPDTSTLAPCGLQRGGDRFFVLSGSGEPLSEHAIGKCDDGCAGRRLFKTGVEVVLPHAIAAHADNVGTRHGDCERLVRCIASAAISGVKVTGAVRRKVRRLRTSGKRGGRDHGDTQQKCARTAAYVSITVIAPIAQRGTLMTPCGIASGGPVKVCRVALRAKCE